MSSIDKLLKTLSEAPNNQIAAPMTKRIKSLVGASDEIVAIELKEILDACESGTLASNFAMKIIDEALASAKIGNTK